MKKSELKAYINKIICKLEDEINATHVELKDFIPFSNVSENEIIKMLDEMTDRLERCYLITCPDCCDDVAIITEIPTGNIIYVCDCSVKFELKLKHISLLYKIKKTA